MVDPWDMEDSKDGTWTLAVNPRGMGCRCVARQNIDSGPCYMQCNCCFADSDSNIQLHVSPLLLLICR